ncbi:hypothetical protein [Vitiosangium sp. GDMCC 1.1324]|uniref:hypothetical protein n=1 Tax=Vitiosangium sp. (strain GDMCC 1.1324) TaxID=2138576 RepID=UPI000D3A59D3|nr:hypothetical protein [Vitiosangium sp. GDMCC 1.1324]PTL81485.1 hypothetical protein DAT35_21190 [Vitiosangium sp. GDMCC 1.1324]
MFLTLLATLVVLGQAPASSEAPLTVLIAPPEAAGVPSHIVSFAQEHVSEQLKTQGFQVVRASDLSQQLPPAQRKTVLGCNRLEAACRITMGEAAQADVVLITELVQFLSGYRVGLKAYATRDGELLSEHYVPGVHEDQLLDALTESSEKVVTQVRQALRPVAAPVVQAPPPTKQPVQPLQPTRPEVTATRSGAPGLAWVPAAGGAVLLGVGTYFYLQAGADYRKLKEMNVTGPEDGAALVQSGKRSQLLSQGAFALGAAGVVTTGLIYLLSGKGEGEQKVRPTASVLNGGGVVGVAGTLP